MCGKEGQQEARDCEMKQERKFVEEAGGWRLEDGDWIISVQSRERKPSRLVWLGSGRSVEESHALMDVWQVRQRSAIVQRGGAGFV